ncbi:MAG: ABC transporter ATP-binding protein [Aigarchaeota archaeon]|nr:ABC transporter ATP-binding protein [Candidatus Pelearchaeum maunauluense]
MPYGSRVSGLHQRGLWCLPSVWRSRVAEFLEAFGLSGREGELLAGYSRGMKQKIALMAAFLHRPRVLILDEPLSGLDPKSARLVKEMLHKLALDGTTTIISTHVLEIAEAICDRIAILYEGVKIAEGSPGELKLLSESPNSTLEDVFLKLTGSEDVRELVEALVR